MKAAVFPYSNGLENHDRTVALDSRKDIAIRFHYSIESFGTKGIVGENGDFADLKFE